MRRITMKNNFQHCKIFVKLRVLSTYDEDTNLHHFCIHCFFYGFAILCVTVFFVTILTT